MFERLKTMFGRRIPTNGFHQPNVELASHPIPDEAQPQIGSQTNQLFGSADILGDVQEVLGVFNPRLVGIRDKLLMRQDPDIAFGMAIITAPIMNLEWSIESDDPIIKEFCTQQLQRIYRQLALGMSNAVGFGWQAGEKVWQVEDVDVEIQGKDGKIETKHMPNSWVIERTKALDPRTVSLLIDRDGDKWAGIEQSFFSQRNKVNNRIGLFNALLWSFRREQVWGNLRGWPLFWQAYAPWWAYIATDLFCNRYFQRKGDPGYKAHGSSTIIKGGKEIDGFQYMAAQTQMAQSSGSVILPNTRDPISGERMFDIQELSAQQRGDMFDRRLQFLSVKKLRGLWVTDRVGTAGGAGGIGTGESEVHQDTFLMLADQVVKEWVDEILQKQVVDQYVFMNFGVDALKNSRTKVKASGLSAATRDLFKGLITQVMQQEAILEDGGTLKLQDMINGVQLLNSMGIPLRPQEELEKIAAKKEERRAAFTQPAEEEPGGDEVDDEEVTEDLENEGILARGTEEPEDTNMSRLRRVDLGMKGGNVSIDGDQVLQVLAIIKAAAAWEIPRPAAQEALTLMGIEHAEKLLGNAGKGNRPKPVKAEPGLVVHNIMPEQKAAAAPIIFQGTTEVKGGEIHIPEIKIPANKVPKEFVQALAKVGQLVEKITLAGHDDSEEEITVEKDPKTGKKKFRIKRKKKTT